MDGNKYGRMPDENERYWYFRFPADFFDNDAIMETETLLNNTGYVYLVILFKIYCLTVREGGTFTIPAASNGGIDYLNIGHRIRFNDLTILKAAIEHLSNVGLLYISNDPVAPPFATEPVMMTTIYAPQVQNMTGSVKSSSDARRQRKIRQTERETLQSQIAHEVKSEGATPAQKKITLGKFGNVLLSVTDYENIQQMADNADKIIDDYSVDKFAFPGDYHGSDYDELLKRVALHNQKKQAKVELQIKIDGTKKIPTGIFDNVELTEDEWEKLCKKFAEPEKLINHISEQMYTQGYNMTSHYAFAVKCGKEDGWETVAQRMQREAAEVAIRMKQAEIDAKADAEKDAEVVAYYTRKAKEMGVDTWQEAADIMRNKVKQGDLSWPRK